MKLLQIDASALTQGSHSKNLTHYFHQAWSNAGHETLAQLDFAQNPPPHMTEAMIGAYFTRPEERSEAQKDVLTRSDQYLNQLKDADVLLIGTAMYNFTIPSTLKAWIDHVLRVGETFVYTENGPQGLLANKRAVILAASGGDYTQPPMDAMNFVGPYLKTALNFIGIDDVTVINLPGMAGDEASQEKGEVQARQSVDAWLAQLTD
ncbi:FMN-dependent NADH-azoreductase [Thiomicrospira sp. WB1]|uniref:FMN-dependent NADH-azoreductase n=1 Tax=Thiomicrospira sp. WB1 TaxID=1685380 RepID=UPI0007466D4E|nr:NAD(P)H-dependent oxidoreductase [Thiomicrospira sp. WB1]KUJ72536.1 FMN-dependent NADH-azoreductase [Thiomicrospira sp. WB1]